MEETLSQKAQRLGIKPAGNPVAPSGESLLQKAQRLGIKPAKPKQEIDTYGAILPSKPTDNPLVAGGKAIVNTPSSLLNLGKSIKDIVMNPIDTVKGIANTAIGGVQKLTPGVQDKEENFDQFTAMLKERYGSLENLQRTATNDPFGFDIRVEGSMKRVKPNYKLTPFEGNVQQSVIHNLSECCMDNGWHTLGSETLNPKDSSRLWKSF